MTDQQFELYMQMQKEYLDERFGNIEKKLDGHIEQHKQNKLRVITNFIAPICTGFIGALIGRFIKG
jgi:hypothetical protein